MRRKTFLSTLAVAVSAFSLSAAVSSGDALAQDKDTLNVVQAAVVNMLEPDFESARPSLRISSEIVESITKYVWDGKDYKLQPSLAEKWEQVDDHTWRFHLRPGVKFTNGEPLTAEAVRFTKDVYMENKRSGPPLVGDLEIKVVDDLTFDVVTKVPNLPTVPAQLSFLYVYPPAYHAEVKTQGFGNAPIGTGPYMLDSWQKGVAITLKANPHYWGGAPKLAGIQYRFISEPATALAALKSGEIQWTRRVFFFVSAKHKPTDDVRVRQAIAYAIDRTAIVSSLLAQDAVPLKGIYLPGEIGYEASFEGVPYDPEKAKALLAEAGFANGVTIDLHFNQDGTVMEPYVAQAVQAQLAKVGITANLDGAAQSIMIQKYGAGDSTGMSLANYAPIYADSSFLVSRAYFASKSRYGGYLEADDKQLDEMGAAANLTTDAAFRQKTYAEIEKHVIVDKAYWVPLYQLVDSYGVSKKIDWNPRPDQNFDFGTASVR